MTANPLTLVYDPVCPFAQRAWLALLEKEIPFAKLKVNHRKKEKVFTDIYSEALGRDPSSKGKVPIIMHANKIIAESDLICWYL